MQNKKRDVGGLPLRTSQFLRHLQDLFYVTRLDRQVGVAEQRASALQSIGTL
jgi:hypothetical protein